MTIGFSPTIPWWVVILTFLTFSGFTIWVYRKHDLEEPWSAVLPGLRILVIAIVTLMLKQPRLLRAETQEERGRIAILVDNSGSMSVSDDYSLAHQIELASQLQLFEPSFRCDHFAAESEYLRDVARNLQRITRRLQGVQQSVELKNLGAVERGVKEIYDYLAISRKALEGVPKRIQETPKRFEYLSGNRSGSTSTRAEDSRARGLTYKRWENVKGWGIDKFMSSLNGLGPPKATQLLPNFDALQNVGEQTGTVITGYLHPPLSGNYVFHIAADDQGILFLSSDTDPAIKQEVCRTPNWTVYRRFDAYPQQKSKPIRLQAHKLYYVEAVLKEETGQDHLTVGWTRPDGRIEAPIPGEYLTPSGVNTNDYFGPDYDRLHPEVVNASKDLLRRFDELETRLRSFLDKGSAGINSESLQPLVKELKALEARVSELEQSMDYLQESADMRLAYADIRPVNNALVRLRQMSRADLTREILTGPAFALLQKFKERGDPKIFVLGEEARHISDSELPVLKNRLVKTNLAKNVRDVFKYFENQVLAGVVVISDGNDNSGQDLRDVRRIAQRRDVPLICLGVGSNQPPRDVAIEGVVSPENSFRNDEITVSAVVKRDGYTGENIEVALLSEGITLAKKRIPPGLESRVTIELPFIETRSGSLEYTLRAQYFNSEQVSHNNRRTFKINILKNPLRVFLLDSFPRWETRFLTMMMERDKRFQVTTVYCGMGGDATPKPLPINATLLSYDIFILGDVNPDQFTGDQFDTVRSFVNERQGTLLFLSGAHHMPSRYLNSPLADLLPVNRLESSKTRLREGVTIQLEITPENSFDSMVRIADTPEISRMLWRDLPALDWVASGVTAARTADELVTAKSTEIPILARRSVNQGNVIYVGSDSFWRWRDRAQWKYYHRLWGQLLLWAALDRTGSSNPYVKLMTDRPEYRPNDVIEVTVKISGPSGIPLNKARPTLDVYDQTTEKMARIVQLKYIENSKGKYVARLKGLPFGKYRASAHVPDLEGKDEGAEIFFEVRNLPSTEYMNLTLNSSALKSLATHYLSTEEADRVAELIPNVIILRELNREISIWDTFPVLGLIALLLGVEWVLRKRQNLS